MCQATLKKPAKNRNATAVESVERNLPVYEPNDKRKKIKNKNRIGGSEAIKERAKISFRMYSNQIGCFGFNYSNFSRNKLCKAFIVWAVESTASHNNPIRTTKKLREKTFVFAPKRVNTNTKQ